MAARTFAGAVRAFVKDATWMTDEDLPAVVSLQKMAAELDKAMSPALLSQYGLAYRSLLKRSPTSGAEGSDPVDDIFGEARG